MHARQREGARLVSALLGVVLTGCPATPGADDADTEDASADDAAADARAEDAGPPDTSTLDARSEGGGTFALSDGTRLDVDDEGTLTLSRADGSPLTSIAAPRLRTFDESTRMLLGVYTTTRRNEVTHPLHFARVREGAESVDLTFIDPRGGELVLSARVGEPMERTSLELTPSGTTHDAVLVPFACDTDATFLGFGEQYDALDHRGESFELFSSEQGIGRVPGRPRSPTNGDRHTTYFPMPYWLDLRGFGVLVDAEVRMTADVCASDLARATVEVESRDRFLVEILHGPSPLEVIEELGDHVGRPARPISR
jgi:hypothetical protein